MFAVSPYMFRTILDNDYSCAFDFFLSWMTLLIQLYVIYIYNVHIYVNYMYYYIITY